MRQSKPVLKSRFTKDTLEAGCDEAGRGCLAGPVCAAAVILPYDFTCFELNDSKLLSENKRNKLREIIEREAISWAVAKVDNLVIDEINILQASIMAMHLALSKLKVLPGFLLIDGNHFKPYKNIPFQCIIKGDRTYTSIAAASVLAKTHRDEYMRSLHDKYPTYKWNRNKGYPTKDHKTAIRTIGISEYHRKSFRLNDQLKMDL